MLAEELEAQHRMWSGGAEEAGYFNLNKKKLGEDLITIFNYLLGDYRENGTTVFSEVCGEMIRVNKQ